MTVSTDPVGVVAGCPAAYNALKRMVVRAYGGLLIMVPVPGVEPGEGQG